MHRALLVLSLAVVCVDARASASDSRGHFTRDEIRAARRYPEAFLIDPASIRLTQVGVLHPGGAAACARRPAAAPPSGPVIDPGTVINIGKEIWQIIQDNRPVVDIHQTYATALPAGITDWNQLDGWKEPEGAIYEYTAGNLWGWTVIDVKFQVLRTWGGGYKGVGKYLTNVTTEPLLVDVFWGYKFTMNALVPKESVANVGTGDAPVAAMVHKLNWRIQTVVKDLQGTDVFYVQGNGVFKRMGGPQPLDLRETGRKVGAMLEQPVRW